ncbi:MAG: hypothetical protein V3S66_00670 [Desulfobacterales bacterium]
MMIEPLIFFAGAPGSRWSTVGKVICQLPIFDNSDQSARRNYQHHEFAGHFGNYFGPGMEFGHNFDKLDRLTQDEIASELRRPFGKQKQNRYRLVKSHVFSYHLDHIRNTFPQSGIMVVWRDSRTCLDWWLKLGGFDIPYPDYTWYRDEETMSKHIQEENRNIEKFVDAQGLQLELMQPEWIRKVFNQVPEIVQKDYFPDVYVAANFAIHERLQLINGDSLNA